MANWDYVFPLNRETIEWLDGEGLSHPQLMPTNRMPSTREIKDAVSTVGELPDDLQIDLDFDNVDHVPEGCFKMRGNVVAELRILRQLADSCGQLWMYPDTGEIAIIVDVTIDPDVVASVWHDASDRDHDWHYFYRHVYATEQRSG